jgi:hypothetical protein
MPKKSYVKKKQRRKREKTYYGADVSGVEGGNHAQGSAYADSRVTTKTKLNIFLQKYKL